MTFVRNCQTTTTHTLPGINLMRNCGVQVFGIDLNASYQTAFGYIRQLAIHLRNSMAIKSQVRIYSQLVGLRVGLRVGNSLVELTL